MDGENRISLRDGGQPATLSIAILGGLFGDYVEYPVGPSFFLVWAPSLERVMRLNAILGMLGETELGSAGVQPDKG